MKKPLNEKETRFFPKNLVSGSLFKPY